MSKPFAQVALNLPVGDAYDYAVPHALRERLRVGMRVRVPFGPRQVTGYCVRLLDEPTIDPAKVKPIAHVVDAEPLVDAKMLELTRWVADYYACSWGEVLEAALPAGVRHGVTSRTIRVVEPVLTGSALVARVAQMPERQRKRRAVMEALVHTEGEELTRRQLADLAGASVATVDAARDDGLIRYRDRLVTEHPIDDVEPETVPRINLTPEQEQALAAVEAQRESGQFGVVLLHGVTGSGKTEVYLRAIRRVVDAGRQAIVLVPEISLTPQTIRRFKARFPRVAVLHSHLTPGQRYEQWRTIFRGDADVVIGPRSAIFAPVQDLGLVVVDEEHENTFKQESVPRYNARDVAVWRGRQHGAAVVLGSATPSLESYHNARRGRYRHIRLARRVRALPMPPVEVVDMTAEYSEAGRRVFLSHQLELRMREALDSDSQVMLFLNRRGYSTLIFCPRCQHALTCPQCEVPMVYHRRRDIALCHYCGEQMPAHAVCPECLGARMLHFGAGTERIEDEIARKFPQYAVMRMDSDTTRGRTAHQELLDRFRSGEARILVGTQMIAKGLDFPQVTLVGVVSADTSLYLPDFRAAERTFQLVEQVAGRAGRGERGGRVVVQTTNPHHVSILAAAAHDYRMFAHVELDARRDLDYPPFGHLLRVVVTAPDHDRARRRARDLARRVLDLPEANALDLLGPAECPLANLQGKARWQLLLKARDRRPIHLAARALRPAAGASGKTQVALDIDPYSML
ncbi:MAG: replication restart helicase PriA [Planctomycetota bacterium]